MPKNKLMERVLVVGLSSFWIVALMNPVFKKYDYGAGWPMVLLLCLSCLGIAWAVRKDGVGWSKLIRNEQIFLGLFLGFSALSFIFSETRTVGFNELMAFGGVSCVYLMFAYRRVKWMGAFLKVVALGAVLAAGFGFYIYLFKEAPPRMIGPFFNIFYHSHLWPNAFALFLIMAWPLVLLFQGESLKERGVSAARLWFIGLCIVLAALFLTYSRGAYLSFLGQVVLLAGFFYKKIDREFMKKAVAVVLITGLITIGANFIREARFGDVVSISEKVTFANQEAYTSGQERYDFWMGAWSLTWDRPLVGYGPYSFKYVYEAKEQRDLLAIADHPHNVFLKIGAENGAIAMGAFILFLFSILYAWWKSFRGMVDEDRALSWVIGVSVAGAFAHSMIDYNLNFVANLLLLFLLLAFFRSLSVGVGVGAGVGEQKSYTKKPVAVRAKLLLAGLVFVLAAYESGVLVLSQIDEDAREWSLYPRNYYLNLADEALQNGEFNQVEELALKQVELNPYDGQSWYLLGATYFSAVNPEFNEMKAAEYFNEAIQVNPFNDLNYYREYLSALISFGDQGDIERLRSGLLALLADYEVLIKYNVHFTTYTPNADAAVDLYRILAMYFPEPNSGAVPYDHMFGEGNVNAELMQKADDLQDIIDEIRASRKL